MLVITRHGARAVSSPFRNGAVISVGAPLCLASRYDRRRGNCSTPPLREALLQVATPSQPSNYLHHGAQRRRFAGRSSRGSGDSSAASPAKETTVENAEADSASSEPGPTSSSAGAAASSVSGSAKEGMPPALFVLPLFRKPAFPGFYQVVQVSEQEVLEFLFHLKKQGQGEYLGGFMTKKEHPSLGGEGDEGNGMSVSSPTKGLRRDAGKVDAVSELEEVGTALQVISLTQYPNINGGQVVVMPRQRIRRSGSPISNPSANVPLATVRVEYVQEPKIPVYSKDATADGEDASEVASEAVVVKTIHEKILAVMKELLKTSTMYKEQFEQVIRFYDVEDSLKLANLVAGMSMAHRRELQEVLVEDELIPRMEKVLKIAKKDSHVAQLQSEVKTQVEEKVSKVQRKLMLMEQMKQITKELGIEQDDKSALITKFRDAIKDKTLPEEASKVVEAELARLGTIEPSSSEYNVSRTYLEWLTVMPWGQTTAENRDIQKAETTLNEDHYGLEDVKERILEHIAVSFLKESTQGKIMCLVGPPGTGKTSVGKSIAKALDRKFYRFSVGGMHDVAEIRGHRRTYVGAMPGKLIQCLKMTQSSNPVVLIDELDKLGRGFRGDPSSALLEVLDPEQNSTFRDHYLDVPVDLSNVLFVCTANVTDTIPGPLLDRMEIIRIAGYVFEEKVAIANQYLIPSTVNSSGVGPDAIDLEVPALHKMITEYAREAGVRNLQKLLEKISRKVALDVVRKNEGEEKHKAVITTGNITDYIGQPMFMSERLFMGGTPPGVVMGLAWTAMGGATLYVEATGRLPRSYVDDVIADKESSDAKENDALKSKGDGGGGGAMQITGHLGKVMSESSAVSLTYARLFVRELDLNNGFLDDARVHLHVPEGATPKDGPSAGVTMTSALVSLALDKPIKQDLAMTGEITLTGKVLKVGGIKEKVIAARREGVKTLLLPRQNEADFSELKDYLRVGVTAHFCDHFDDIYRLAFEESEEEQMLPLPGPPRGLPVVSMEPPIITPATPSLIETTVGAELPIGSVPPTIESPAASL